MAAVAVSGLMLVEFVRAFTFSVAVLLVAPGPLSAEVIAPVVLFFEPVVVPVTLSEIVHEPLAASVPADKLIEPDPAVAVVVPLHVLLRLLGFATTSPAGKLSVNTTPFRPVVFGLLIVNVRLVLAFSGIEAAPNAFVIVGGVATVMLAEAVFPVPPLAEVTAPVVLFFAPEVVPFTFTEKVQEALAASVAPDRLTELEPATAVMVPPPQVPLRPLGVLTTNPVGRVSVKATPVSETVLAAGLVMVKLRLVVPFTGMEAAPNDLLMPGGPTTDSVCCTEAVPADAVSVGVPPIVSL